MTITTLNRCSNQRNQRPTKSVYETLPLMDPWSVGRKRTTSLNHEKTEARLHCIDPTHSLHQRRGIKVGENASFSSKIWSTAQTGLPTKWRPRLTVGADDNESDCTWRRRNKTLITLDWRLATVALQLTFPQIYYGSSVRKGNKWKWTGTAKFTTAQGHKMVRSVDCTETL